MATSKLKSPKLSLSRFLQRNASSLPPPEPDTTPGNFYETPASFYDNEFMDFSKFKGMCTTCGYISGRAFGTLGSATFPAELNPLQKTLVLRSLKSESPPARHAHCCLKA